MAATMELNGPTSTIPMYYVKPYQSIDVVELPDVMYKVNSYHAGTPHSQSSPESASTPLAALERRQDDVLRRLEQLRGAVCKLKERYHIAETATSTPTTASASGNLSTSATSASTLQSDWGEGILDLVINAEPPNIPYSILVLCERLASAHKVIKSTFVHSSVSSSDVPDKLQRLFTSNGGLKREEAKLALTLVWKKVSNGPQLVVDPSRHTPIFGEVNIARYLTRLLQPGMDQTDIVRATQMDDLLDLAQLQLAWGNAKERAAGLRSLNATLGMKSEDRKGWLLAGAEPSTADFVVWSVLHQTGQASGAPANVKKWLKLCEQHVYFEKAVALLS